MRNCQVVPRFRRLIPLSRLAMIKQPMMAPMAVPLPPRVLVPPRIQPVMALNSKFVPVAEEAEPARPR